MEAFLNSQFSTTDFGIYALFLMLVYVLLRFSQNLLQKVEVFARWQLPIKNGIALILLVFEPLAILILTGMLVMINPPFNLLLAAVVLLAGLSHIKNYLSGRLMFFDKNVVIGNQISTEQGQGFIENLGRLGLKLRTSKGLRFIGYTQLMSDGYLLIAGEEVGSWYQLKVSPQNLEEKVNHPDRLKDLLAITPYIDWQHPPQIDYADKEQQLLRLKLMVREDSHMEDLLELFQEWGYSYKISKP